MAHEEAFVLRNKLDELARNVANSDLVVMTLGLTETWFDTSSKVAFNGLNVVAIKHRRATTAFFNATVAQVFEVLADALEKLIERNPDRKSVVEGKSVQVRVDLGGRRIFKNKHMNITNVSYI